MGLVQMVPNLIQGVSQQAPQQRRDSQCEEQFDCFNSPLDGVAARPPAELVRFWPGRSLDRAFFHEIVRGEENYVLAFDGTIGVHAIDLSDGTDCAVVNEAEDVGYLGTSTPSRSFRAQTVDDTTFILNRDISPRMGEERSRRSRPEAIIFVRAPAYASGYNVSVSGPGGTRTATYTTPTNEEPGNAFGIQTEVIATRLGEGLRGNGYSVTQAGSSLLVYRDDGQDFDVSASDANGDDFMYAFKGSSSSYGKLPRKGFDGFLLRVQGESRTKTDDFFVRFEGAPTTGAWRETVAPGIETHLARTHMPHIVVQTGYRTFAYRRPHWSSRIAGDEETAKTPSFVGRRLKDVFYHSARLGLLYEGGCVWSKSRFPFTFFPDTAQTVLDNAPVDITVSPTASTKGAAFLDFAVQVDEGLYLWAPRAQFRVSSGSDPFRQDTAEAPLSSAFEYASDCDPLALGSLLYTAADVGQYASLRSLQFSQGRPVGDQDVTAHVAKFIPSGVRGLTASDVLRCMFVWTEGAHDRLYVYNYLLQEREYAQSAWNCWRIPGGKVLWASIQDDRLSVLQQRPEGLALLRFTLTPKAVDSVPGSQYQTRLDLRIHDGSVAEMTYDAVNDLTRFRIPYTPRGPAFRVVLRANASGGRTRGLEFPVTAVNGNLITVRGDLRGTQFFAGQTITAQRRESKFYVRSDQGVLPTDRLTIERFRVEMADTGYTRIEVRPARGPLRTREFTGRVLGAASGTTGTPMLSDEFVDAQVGYQTGEATIDLINDSFLPSYWQTASYEYSAVGVAGQR